jgi:hypothetical protein
VFIKEKYITPGIFFIHTLIMIAAFFLLHQFGYLLSTPTANNIATWDAGIFATIRDKGYFFHPEGPPWNTGMFPLFPYTWKWSMLGAPGICMLNYLVMLGAFWWLTKTYRFPPLLQFWLLAVPSMLFFFLPYSEAFFFLSATMIIAGVEKDNRWLMSAGIYFAMLSRGTGLFFIPIVIAMEWMPDFSFRKEILIHVARRSFLPVMSVALAIATIAIIQYVQTGYAFSFFSVQTIGTGKHLHGLFLPLTTWYQVQNLWADGLAAVAGILSTVILFFTVWGKPDEYEKGKPLTWTTKVVRFSMMYLAIQVWYVIFNAPVHAGTGCTSIMSLGRYVFCNPFWMIFALAIVNRPKLSSPILIISMVCVFLVICLMGARTFFSDDPYSFWTQFSDPPFAYHVCMLLLTLPVFFANRSRVAGYLLGAGYLAGIIMQLVLFDAFTSGNWVG